MASMVSRISPEVQGTFIDTFLFEADQLGTFYDSGDDEYFVQLFHISPNREICKGHTLLEYVPRIE